MHKGTLVRLPTTRMNTFKPLAAPPVTHTRIWEVLLLGIAYLAMYGQTYKNLNDTIWSQVGQGHGPLMLALTCWLAWQRWQDLAKLSSSANSALGTFVLTIGLALFIVGHSQNILMFDAGSQIFVLAGLLLLYKGTAAVRLMWLPLLFIIFVIPLPGFVVDTLTGPMKSGVSYVSEQLLHIAGYPIGRSGVTLTIGQYKLLVADACAGLNSLFALEAIGVFYLSIMQYTNAARNIALAVCIIPIAFISNVIRVIVLVLVTYYFGDEAGQGFVHDFAGILLFVVATALTILLDTAIGKFVPDHKNAAQSKAIKPA